MVLVESLSDYTECRTRQRFPKVQTGDERATALPTGSNLDSTHESAVFV
jgi:hypothetical protein